MARVFTTGTMAQVFLLARGVPADSWSGNGSAKCMVELAQKDRLFDKPGDVADSAATEVVGGSVRDPTTSADTLQIVGAGVLHST